MAGPPVLTRYSLSEKAKVMGIGLDLDHLRDIDDLWTAYLESAGPEDVEREIDELDELARNLVETMAATRDSVGTLLSILEATGEEEIDSALRQIGERYPGIEQGARERLAELLAEYSFRGVAIEASGFLVEQLPREIEAVEKKRRRLLAGEFQTGDMSPPARCARAGAKLGASVLLVVMTGGGAAPVLLGGALALIDLSENWEEGCGRIAGTIWGRLRGA
jgi:hypothetical protein